MVAEGGRDAEDGGMKGVRVEVPRRPPEGTRRNEVLKTSVIIHNGET